MTGLRLVGPVPQFMGPRVGYLRGTTFPRNPQTRMKYFKIVKERPIYNYFGRNVKKYPMSSHEVDILSHPDGTGPRLGNNLGPVPDQ